MVGLPLGLTSLLIRKIPLLKALILLVIGLCSSGYTIGSDYARGPSLGVGADLIVVEKSQQRMLLFRHGLVVREYPIALGFNPEGHKRHEGDGRTPEGRYELVWRNPNSAFYRALQISYPNEHDIIHARLNDLEPGGKIMIHGSPNWVPSNEWAKQYLQPKNWTEGCIAVTNDVMDEIWYAVELGTPIEIRP